MKKLEDFISDKREQFDFLEPSEGHFFRFQRKIDTRSGRSLKWSLRIAVATIILVFLSVNLLVFHSGKLDPVSLELKETAYYYDLRSEKILTEIEKSNNLDSYEKQHLLDDLQNFDKESQDILDDLQKFPGDERLIDAFIEFHKSKSEFLEGLLNQINNSKLITI